MKLYKEYMDNITVPDPLHQKLVSHAPGKGPAGETYKSPVLTAGKGLSCDTGNSPLNDTAGSLVHAGNRRSSRIAAARRYAAAFACLAVVLACICAAPHLWRKANLSARLPGHTGSMPPDKSLSEPFPESSSEPLVGPSVESSSEPSIGPFSISQAGSDLPAGSGKTSDDMQHNNVPHVSEQDTDPAASDALVKYITDPDESDSGPIGTNTVFRNDHLSLEEARADTDFGAYLPKRVPSGFAFESASRYIDKKSNFLSVLWFKGMGEIHWTVSKLEEKDKARITSVADKENYDLALYPIPRAESVPKELREIVNDPIFIIDDLTLEAVKARSYEVRDTGDVSGPRMGFSVLYGEILVKLNVKGASPEEVFDMLMQVGK
jgi:hypothetical protein